MMHAPLPDKREAQPVPYFVFDAPPPETPDASKAIRFGGVVFLSFFGFFAAWSYWAPLTEAAVAEGEIRVEGQRRTVSHFEGGIIAAIHVREGETVQAGQRLMTLGDSSALADVEALRHENWALMAQAGRLEAEMAGLTQVTFPVALVSQSHSVAQEAMAGQQRLLEIRRENLANQLALFEARIGQHRANIDALKGTVAAQRIQLSLLQKEERNASQLRDQGLQRLPQVLALRRGVAMTEGTIVSEQGNIARESASIGEVEQSMLQAKSNFMKLAAEERQSTEAKLALNAERLRAAEDVLSRLEIRAPETGRVFDLRYVTEGAAVERGAPILDIVPTSDRLVAEVKLQPSDVDTVQVGLTAEIRLTGLTQRNAPYLQGQVSFIAADVTQGVRAADTSHYRAQVTFDQGAIEQLDKVELRAGMPVQVMIKTGERSLFAYLTQPLLSSFNRAFREP